MKTLVSFAKGIFVITLVSIFLFSCKKDKVKVSDFPKVDNTSDTTGTIYAAGYRITTNARKVAVYWKDKTRVSFMDSFYNSEAMDIEVLNNFIYICGNRTNGTNQMAVYWKDNVETILSVGSNFAGANAMVVDNGDIYTAGYEANSAKVTVAKYWKNRVSVDLTDGSRSADARAIAVVGSDIYVAGYEVNASGVMVAKYWKNGTEFILSDGKVNTSANSIAVSGTDVHIAGASFDVATNTYTTKYWKNTDLTDLNTGSSGVSSYDMFCNAVTINNGNVYVGGNSVSGVNSMKPTYWKNGTPFTNQSSASYTNQVTSIYVYGGKVYLGGFGNYYGTGPSIGMVWTADIWRGLEFSSAFNKINSIYVVN